VWETVRTSGLNQGGDPKGHSTGPASKLLTAWGNGCSGGKGQEPSPSPTGINISDWGNLLGGAKKTGGGPSGGHRPTLRFALKEKVGEGRKIGIPEAGLSKSQGLKQEVN